MRKLFLVEDSPTQAAVLQARFELANLNVTTVHNGKDALKKVEQLCPDLIVLDFQLPDLNGVEVCKQIKSNSQLRIIPIVMFSIQNSLRRMVEAYEAGADYYVVKDEYGERVLELLIESVFVRLNRRRNKTNPFPITSVA